MKKTLIAALALCALLSAIAIATATARPFPGTIALPDDWGQAEGIASGRGPTFYAGSVTDGAVYRGSYRTGRGSVLVDPPPGRAAAGLKYDRRRDRLFVAGAGSQQIYVYDAQTGAERVYPVAGSGFINDVVVTRRAAYFTDSTMRRLYRIPIGRRGALGDLEVVPITGDLVYGAGFNANGIAATRNGKALIIVQSNTGKLFRADPRTGVTREIELDRPVTNGDGILLAGRTLFVARNRNELIAVVRLSPRLRSGVVRREIGDPRFDVPTTLAAFGGALYAVNARFQPEGDNHNPSEDIVRVKP
jgi:sugar lactone lactonase YvrE